MVVLGDAEFVACLEPVPPVVIRLLVPLYPNLVCPPPDGFDDPPVFRLSLARVTDDVPDANEAERRGDRRSVPAVRPGSVKDPPRSPEADFRIIPSQLQSAGGVEGARHHVV